MSSMKYAVNSAVPIGAPNTLPSVVILIPLFVKSVPAASLCWSLTSSHVVGGGGGFTWYPYLGPTSDSAVHQGLSDSREAPAAASSANQVCVRLG